MKNRITLLVLCTCAFMFKGYSQMTIGAASAPNAASVLDLHNATTLGLYPTQVPLSATNVAAPVVAPPASLLVYNTATAGASPNNVTPGYYYWDGAKWVRLFSGNNAASDAWLTTGNGGTVPGTNFLGTIDNNALEFKVNNIIAGYLDQTNAITVYGRSAGNIGVSTATNLTAIGVNALSNLTSGTRNTGVGTNALSTTSTGNDNTAVGYFTLNSNTGTGNTAFGSQTLSGNTAGGDNTAVGYFSLHLSTGNGNTALGSASLAANTSGDHNLALGYQSLNSNTTASNNTAVGFDALQNNLTGASNTAVGFQSQINSTAGNNTSLGYNSLQTNTTGTSNTAIGYQADVSAAGLTNATALGANAIVGASNSLVLGSTASGTKVGIGANSPAQSLEVGYTTGTVRIDGLKAGNSFNPATAASSSTMVFSNNITGDLYALQTPASGVLLSVANVPTWASTATSLVNAENGINVNTTAPASPANPYVELGGALVRPTTVSGDNANNLTFSSTATTLSPLIINASTITTGSAETINVNGLTSGNGLAITSISTAGTINNTSALINLNRSGANANNPHTAYGIYSSVTNSGAGSQNIAGYFTTNNGASINYGVYGQTLAASGEGIYGYNNAPAGIGTGVGVHGQTNQANGYAVYGVNTSTSAGLLTTGVYGGKSGNTVTGTGYGIYGVASGTGAANYGGYFSGSGATANYGVVVPAGGGNSGFGTITPITRLEVGGTGAGTTARIDALTAAPYNIAAAANSANLVYADNTTGDLYSLPTANSSVLITTAGGIPQWSGAVANGLFWSLTGNSGALSSASAIGTAVNNKFIGTTDANNWVLATNNLERMRVMSAGNIGIQNTAPTALLDINTSAVAGAFNVTAGNVVNVTANALTTGTALNVNSTGTITGVGTLATLTANSLTTGTVLNVSANALTSGKGIAISSTNAITTGSLLNLSHTTGAITNAGGSLLNISSTAANTAGYLSTIVGSSTTGSIANISGAALTTGTALNVASGGFGINSVSTSTTTGQYAVHGSTVSGKDAYLGYYGSATVVTYPYANPATFITNSTTGNALVVYTSGATSGTAIVGLAGSSGNGGTFISNSSSTANSGLISLAINAGGSGIVAAGNNQATNNIVGGSGGGFNGTAAGVVGYAYNATGVGVHGVSNANTVLAITPANGAGGSFVGSSLGEYGTFPATTSSGSSYINILVGNEGQSSYSGTSGGNITYQFGTYGEKDWWNQNNHYDLRSGGVLGTLYDTRFSAISAWGSLGYLTSGAAQFGAYSSAGLVQIGTGGKSINNQQPKTGFGLGAAGDLMGAMIQGNIYGATISGSRYGMYVDGAVYTNKPVVELIDNGTDSRTVSYSVASLTADVYAHGKGKLVNGKAVIQFDAGFQQMIDAAQDISITVTPLADCNGIHLKQSSPMGFGVEENSTITASGKSIGTSNTEFTWIAVGTRKDIKKSDIANEVLSKSFEQNVKGVLGDNADPNSVSTPMWWNGNTVKFTTPPDNITTPGIKVQHPKFTQQKKTLIKQ